jgi:CheY-like chemotaxis protein
MSQLQRVMCVEDDPDIRMILEFSLAAVGGYFMCMCSGGQAALEQAPLFLPDMILLDVMMPDMSGPETLAALRQQPGMKGVPVVFITAKAMPDELEALLEHGAAGVIIKPFDPMTLPEDIRIYWERGRDIFPG